MRTFLGTEMCLPHTPPLYLYIHEDLMTKVRQLPSAASTYTLCKWIQLCHTRTLVGDLTDVVPFNRCLNPLLQLKHKLSEEKKKRQQEEKQYDIIPEQTEGCLTPISQISHGCFVPAHCGIFHLVRFSNIHDSVATSNSHIWSKCQVLELQIWKCQKRQREEKRSTENGWKWESFVCRMLLDNTVKSQHCQLSFQRVAMYTHIYADISSTKHQKWTLLAANRPFDMGEIMSITCEVQPPGPIVLFVNIYLSIMWLLVRQVGKPVCRVSQVSTYWYKPITNAHSSH